MDPWKLVGWIVAIFLILALAPLVGRLFYGFLIALPAAIISDARAARLRSRADAGKVRCQHSGYNHTTKVRLPCKATAVRRTPNGYYCNDHWNTHSRKGGLSYAFLLKHAQEGK